MIRFFKMFGFIVLLASALVRVSLAFPSGAPSSSCFNMMPLHRSQPQEHPSPYALTIKSGVTTYSPNATIDVEIHAPTTGENVRGFILEARTISGLPRGPVGTFINDDRSMKTICEDKALTHRTWRSKAIFKGSWKAPLVDIGDIVFVATVLKKYETFWTNVRSSVLTPYTPTPPPVDEAPLSDRATTINMTEVCQEAVLKPIPDVRPHVAILCASDADCPCDWLCCSSCSTECYGHAICRQKVDKPEVQVEGAFQVSAAQASSVYTSRTYPSTGRKTSSWK